jgi:hypothetical protein
MILLGRRERILTTRRGELLFRRDAGGHGLRTTGRLHSVRNLLQIDCLKFSHLSLERRGRRFVAKAYEHRTVHNARAAQLRS